jgi:putative membrane protein
MYIILRLILNALGVMLAANVVPGIYVRGFGTALLVALVLSVLNVVVGWPLKILTLPLTIISLGLFLLIINTLLFYMATFVKGFEVSGFWPAFFGSVIVTVVSMVGKRWLKSET